MRTDSLDRFGTRLEQRFTRKQIERTLPASGLVDIAFNRNGAFWTAVVVRGEQATVPASRRGPSNERHLRTVVFCQPGFEHQHTPEPVVPVPAAGKMLVERRPHRLRRDPALLDATR